MITARIPTLWLLEKELGGRKTLKFSCCDSTIRMISKEYLSWY